MHYLNHSSPRIIQRTFLLTLSRYSDHQPSSFSVYPASKTLEHENNQNYPRWIGMAGHPWEKHCSSCLPRMNATKRREWSTKQRRLRSTTKHPNSQPCSLMRKRLVTCKQCDLVISSLRGGPWIGAFFFPSHWLVTRTLLRPPFFFFQSINQWVISFCMIWVNGMRLTQ